MKYSLYANIQCYMLHLYLFHLISWGCVMDIVSNNISKERKVCNYEAFFVVLDTLNVYEDMTDRT